MADITIHAAYASYVEDEDEGLLFIGFAQGEDEDEPYALFRQSLGGGPVYFEVNDEDFGADEAVAQVIRGPKGLDIALAPEVFGRFGAAETVAIRIGPQTEDAEEAVEALRLMLGHLWREA